MEQLFEGAIYNQEAEYSAIGALFIEGDLVKECILQPENFYFVQCRTIFEAIKNVDNKDIPVDLVSVVEELGSKLDQVGGVNFLSELAGSVPTTANFSYYQNLVLEHWKMRKAIQEANNLKKELLENKDLSALNTTVANLLRIDEHGTDEDFDLKETMVEMYLEMEVDQGDLTGVDTGFTELNHITNGFQRQDLIIVAARPSVGKTTFCLNIAENVSSARNGKPSAVVGIFSLEMKDKLLLRRMCSSVGRINATKMRNPKRFFDNEDWTRLTRAMGEIEKKDLFIYDKPAVTVQEIYTKARKLRNRFEDRDVIIIIDYLQLIQGSPKHGGNRTAEIGEISRMLKIMARELDITVIALSQLSRGVESRQDKRPTMSDIRESGQIEQDADVIAFLYRDDYYDKETEKKDIIEIIVAKQRNGPVGLVELAFLKEYSKFVNLERRASQ